MQSVQVPLSAQPLLRYMKQDKNAAEDAFFPTYAHMMIFAAAVGFDLGEFDDDVEFLQSPHPIPFDIFRNNDLYDQALVLTLARNPKLEALQDAALVAKTVEGYSSAGFRHMAKWSTGRDLLGCIVHEIKKLQGAL